MAKHTVKNGQWVGSIAARHGISDWEKNVWKHSDNAELRKTRKSPNLLVTGDKIHIPEPGEKSEDGATEQRHKFRKKSFRDILKIRLLSEESKPLKNTPYTLDIEVDGPGDFVQEKKRTDGQGMLEEKIPRSAKTAQLRLTKQGVLINLKIGHLQPIDSNIDMNKNPDTITMGVKQRLHNLQFEFEDDGQDLNEQSGLEEAIRYFQSYCEQKRDEAGYDAGEVNGRITPKVRKALIKMHEDNDDY